MLKNYEVFIYRKIDPRNNKNELFNQVQLTSDDFEAVKKFLTKILHEIKKEDLEVHITNRVEADIQRRKRKVRNALGNTHNLDTEFIKDINEADFVQALYEMKEKTAKDLGVEKFIYAKKVLAIHLTQRIILIDKNKKSLFSPEKYIIWFKTYFELVTNPHIHFFEEGKITTLTKEEFKRALEEEVFKDYT
ncbi:MAG: hypothetical protein QXX30_00665 [Candidatus Aenigmatarchaeota archaeon]